MYISTNFYLRNNLIINLKIKKLGINPAVLRDEIIYVCKL